VSKVERYSDEWIQLAKAGEFERGDQNAAQWLAQLDTVERRKRAAWAGSTMMNLRGGRYSEMVGDAVEELRWKLARGEEDTEMWAERVARQEREKDQALREIQREQTIRLALNARDATIEFGMGPQWDGPEFPSDAQLGQL
jgi:hypothetical protein